MFQSSKKLSVFSLFCFVFLFLFVCFLFQFILFQFGTEPLITLRFLDPDQWYYIRVGVWDDPELLTFRNLTEVLMVKTQGNCLSISPQPDKICLEVSLHLTFRILLKGLSMHPSKGLSMS